MENKWCYSLNDENYEGAFDTKEEAIEAAKEEFINDCLTLHEGTEFFVGQVVNPTISFDAERIIEEIDENFFAQCGEYADGWYSGISNEDEKILQDKMEELLVWWVEKTNNKPCFYRVENVERIQAITLNWSE